VLRRAMRDVAAKGSGAGPRIYLSRRTMTRRPLVNEAEVIDALKVRGFAILEMEKLDAEAQLAAIAEARLIVAPHGAALVSLLAARPGARCIELFHPRRGTMAFAITAAFADVSYQPILGQAVDPDRWRIDIDEVIRVVDFACKNTRSD
jgi:capsular polysaccharide biosynthesis protein